MNTRNTNKVYGLFYKSHGTWTPFNTQPLTLNAAQNTKSALKRAYKSAVIIRRVKYA